jgi:ribonuclease HI
MALEPCGTYLPNTTPWSSTFHHTVTTPILLHRNVSNDIKMLYDDNFEEVRRLYNPTEDPSSRRIPRDELVVYNTAKQISQLQMKVMARPDPFLDRHSLVVHIDGACRGNGTPGARASYGVYFGPSSPHNAYGILSSSTPQTSTRAEIEALSHALEIICRITDGDYALSRIKIATDSSFLVNAMSRWIEGWIEDGGVGSNGKQVAHYQVLKRLHEKLDYMEYSDDGGRYVKFWLVGREMNRDADALANMAFE